MLSSLQPKPALIYFNNIQTTTVIHTVKKFKVESVFNGLKMVL